MEFQPWLTRWSLVPDGDPFATPVTNSHLLPVRLGGVAAMLKIAGNAHEVQGGEVMAWWNGGGAARVIHHEAGAVLMARALGTRSLMDMVAGGQDEAATEIICHVVSQLHEPRPTTPPTMPALVDRFGRQAERARNIGGVVAGAFKQVNALLAEPRDEAVLHGDVHHGNILDFGDHGWLAIDPQAVRGERAYDYANILKNPDRSAATAKGRLQQQVELIAQASGFETRRLLQWSLCHAALSACWSIEDGQDPALAMEVAEIATAALED